MRRAGLIPALSILGVAAVTGTAYLLGPAPAMRTVSSTLNDPTGGVIEPADSAALIGWFALAIVLALAFAFGLPFSRAGANMRRLGNSGGPGIVLGTLAMGLAIASVTWRDDVTGMWQGISLSVLLTALTCAVLLLGLTLVPRPLARAGSVLVGGLALAYVIPALLQIPSGLRDAYDYTFTSDEIVSVAVGKFPLADYIPQYANLLGFPVAPVLHWLPTKSELVVLAWILFLQVVAIAVAVSLPVLQGGRRYLAPALIVACAPPLMTLTEAKSASTYFADMPMRVVLPSTVILAAYLSLRKRPDVSFRRPGRFLALGAFAGLSALNNPDFGLPVLVVVLVVVFLIGASMQGRLISTGLVATGSLAVFPAYGLMASMAGKSVQWSNWLAFHRVFGTEGFRAVPMAPFGLHIAVVGLFVSASVLGFVMIVSSRKPASSFAYRQGLVLALTGGWSLLSLPYFAGRSLVPTLIGGYSYAVGLVVAALLPLLTRSFRAVRAGMARDVTSASVGLAFGVLAVASAVASMTFVWAPSDYIARQQAGASGRSQPLRDALDAVEVLLASPGNERLRELVNEGAVAQSLEMSGLLELTRGLPSASVASSPAYYSLSPFFVDAICTVPWTDPAQYLLVRADVAALLENSETCSGTFEFATSERFLSGDSAYALLRRADSAS